MDREGFVSEYGRILSSVAYSAPACHFATSLAK